LVVFYFCSMPITKAKKAEIVAELEREVAPSESLVFVNFHGLSVANATTLRKSLRAAGVGLMVAKKTLLKRALAGAKTTGEFPELEGEVAVAYGSDPIAPARGVQAFAKDHADQLRILGGVFEGAYADAATMLTVAAIPSREVLYGKLLNLFNSPLTRFAMVLDGISKKGN
jgi:large subunit ribosomal protein L10